MYDSILLISFILSAKRLVSFQRLKEPLDILLRFINLFSQNRTDKRLIKFPFDHKIDETSFFTLIEGDFRIAP